ncbi:hypothetical protein ACD578_15875 [Microvirga sp. RSM25]|uniref:hypothetical protein n=1 Tax=Microvirga sp. RSM25 TaxID=3273802 RepID=UPI00384B84E8
MSRDLRRRITRLEQSDSQGAIRFDVSDCPLEEDVSNESDLRRGAPLSPILTEDEWYALYAGDEA